MAQEDAAVGTIQITFLIRHQCLDLTLTVEQTERRRKMSAQLRVRHMIHAHFTCTARIHGATFGKAKRALPFPTVTT